jgi:CRP/FNR family transcriptional regulator
LALETVSRGFTRLQEDGVIAVHGRKVEIIDMPELERLVHGDGDQDMKSKARA